MIKKHKGKLLFSSLLILLPMAVGLILWGRLPEYMTTHWGIDGTPDGRSSAWVVVLALPALLLLMHWLCLFITFRDPKNQDQGKKAVRLVFWIVPFISLFANGMIYASVFAETWNLFLLVPLCLGLLMILFGNYMPKIKQNSTLGIKVSWTLNSEENWNATHRFCGKVWVLCGFGILLCMLLPESVMMYGILGLILLMCVISLLYPYLYYRKQLAAGTVTLTRQPMTRKKKIALILTLIHVAAILFLLVYLMFSGNIRVHYERESFTVEASYWDDLTVDYAAIDSIEYRTDFDHGQRIGGFGSARLLLGNFENDEFGRYRLYTYTGCDAAVLIWTENGLLVLGAEDAQGTQMIYNMLKENSDAGN